ncbi:hypothetical protein MPRM_11580 [Mycobacterium parmense]|uniref:Uncharacterized protein n=1 Tax=Mycobacterium parmense TaxID=185642 RepID=A0A7I7YRL2_9MYCO|nr:hypothetical protein MPRM_11580 [Mycobacterium parmense]
MHPFSLGPSTKRPATRGAKETGNRLRPVDEAARQAGREGDGQSATAAGPSELLLDGPRMAACAVDGVDRSD